MSVWAYQSSQDRSVAGGEHVDLGCRHLAPKHQFRGTTETVAGPRGFHNERNTTQGRLSGMGAADQSWTYPDWISVSGKASRRLLSRSSVIPNEFQKFKFLRCFSFFSDDKVVSLTELLCSMSRFTSQWS